MTQPLFVNFKEDFITRIRLEAGPEALATSSMIQALRWISNPDLPISGIYLNPNDVSYSALRFLEISLLQRPATPVFLINDDSELLPEQEEKLLQASVTRMSFKGTESYEELVKPLRHKTPAALLNIQKRAAARSEHAGYLAIPIIDFVNARKYPHDIFVEDDAKELRLFAQAGTEVDADYLSHVSEKSSWVFISEEAIQKERDKLHATRAAYVDLNYLPLSWKSAETLFNAKMLLNEMRKGGLSDGIVDHTHFLLTDVFHLVSHLVHASKLNMFVDQAKQCDRTIACATLSILMCKSLKFEKNAIVEILGLASIFQDISLYNTPHGNLADMKRVDFSPEAHAYFLQHPLLSADLVAQNTSIPDVTLQVMRQHHERKDRTGYPNRIGGMQLHPMAEILSLINSYLDSEQHNQVIDTEIFSHYSDRVVLAFKELVHILDQQRKNVAVAA